MNRLEALFSSPEIFRTTAFSFLFQPTSERIGKRLPRELLSQVTTLMNRGELQLDDYFAQFSNRDKKVLQVQKVYEISTGADPTGVIVTSELRELMTRQGHHKRIILFWEKTKDDSLFTNQCSVEDFISTIKIGPNIRSPEEHYYRTTHFYLHRGHFEHPAYFDERFYQGPVRTDDGELVWCGIKRHVTEHPLAQERYAHTNIRVWHPDLYRSFGIEFTTHGRHGESVGYEYADPEFFVSGKNPFDRGDFLNNVTLFGDDMNVQGDHVHFQSRYQRDEVKGKMRCIQDLGMTEVEASSPEKFSESVRRRVDLIFGREEEALVVGQVIMSLASEQ